LDGARLAFLLEGPVALMTLLRIGGDAVATSKRHSRKNTVSTSRAALAAITQSVENLWRQRLLKLISLCQALINYQSCGGHRVVAVTKNEKDYCSRHTRAKRSPREQSFHTRKYALQPMMPLLRHCPHRATHMSPTTEEHGYLSAFVASMRPHANHIFYHIVLLEAAPSTQ
jgi:hypothetical protein